ncbi:DNA replication/repair protein RecF [Caproiciproducens sp. NJN-50]|uniref:DNA replication/repair protein RecF n=1 Tax=Acutalibacteraceae TaxID=3082771 RepID=UPI000FFE12FD|nr:MULTISPECIES: DNA replication/repair protein RecF [Acutalibacteraceae]QAT48287.1 DNA replication/repair protein RecF [Caproiciproducens sp. NJN-50]
MKVQRLSWKNFRNLPAGEFDPCGEVNVIFGQNAQGKTNLLEAMWLFTGERSFRSAKDAELVLREEPSARLKMDFYSEGREQTAQITVADGRRSAELNGVPKGACSALTGKFCAVVFSPEHLALVRGGPALRRSFVDSALCQIKPGYVSLLSGYNRTLFQRNALLKDIPRHAELMDTLSIWDDRLCQFGERIVRQRTAYLDALASPAAGFYSGISADRETLSLRYLKSADDLRQTLSDSRREDLLNGHTGAGPHRDDVEITVDGMSARAYASQGQKRSAVLALKLAEAELLNRMNGERPVVFLDDVMSELDSQRQDYLLNHLSEFQVFLTCCEPGAARLMKSGALFQMENGVLSVRQPL